MEKRIHARTTHGQSKTPERRAWYKMKERCYSRNYRTYKNYGGRGIKVCERWLESFDNFKADMGPRPSSRHSVDRIDNDGDYSPKNCRWATDTEQNRNRRDNHNLTMNGRTQSLAAWAEEYGMIPATLWTRIGQLGWDIERAILTPVQKGANGSTYTNAIRSLMAEREEGEE